jgi:hypothetical protein
MASTANKAVVFVLEEEDLTHLGGPMGSEYTTRTIVDIFASVEGAKREAEKQYAKVDGREKVEWDGLRTVDLLSRMYHIRKWNVRP